MELSEIKQRIAKPIDLHSLETELQEHVYLFQLATEGLAKLRMEAANCKQQMDVTEAKVSLRIRQQLEAAGTKSTEKLIESMTKADTQYSESFDDYLVAKLKYEEADALRDVFMSREAAMRQLVQLYTAQYWSVNNAGKAVPQADESSTEGFKTRKA